MKKSVVLMIGIIYIAAVVLVGFLGLKMRVYDEKKYVTEIVCISEGYTKNEDSTNDYDGYIRTKYVDGLKVEIKCQVLPDDADNKKVDYIYDETSQIFKVIKNEDGTATVEFLKKGTATITVKAADNVGVDLIIKIFAQGAIF